MRLSVGFAVLALAGCTAAEGDSDRGEALGTDVQNALQGMPNATAIPGVAGAPSYVYGDLGVVSDRTAAGIRGALGTIAPAFRLNVDNLELRHVRTDELGYTHARYRQTKNGLAVVGGDLVLHVNNRGHVYAANGTARDGVTLSPTAAVTPDVAAQIARDGRNLAGATASTPALVYLIGNTDRMMHLAYQVEIVGAAASGLPVRDLVYVDARTREIVEIHPQIHEALSRSVYTANNGTSTPGTLVRSEGQAPVADAIVNTNYDHLGTVYNYYATIHRRDSYDNAGAALVSSVHYGTNKGDAYWDGAQMVYGDGQLPLADNLAKSLDVTAHELTHAVTSHESNLVYSGESGGINEAMSDIMGESVEAWSHGAGNDNFTDAATFLVGEDIWTPATSGDAARYMNDPARDGASLDDYANYNANVDVHNSSGIVNLAWSLLVTGGHHPRNKHPEFTVPAIGKAKASKIFYRANTEYLTSTATFQTLRIAARQAANDLYDGETAAAVDIAFNAVGVPAGASVLDIVGLADVNGDGKKDVVSVGRAGTVGAGQIHVRSIGSPAFAWDSPGRMVDDGANIWLADVNNDGRADLITQGSSTKSAAGWVSVGLSNGTGFAHWTWSSNYRMLDDDAKSWLADVNGDGSADLVTQGGAKESAAGWVSVGLSDGKGRFAYWSWSSYSRMLDDDSKSWLVDVNGDGAADLVTQGGAKESTAGWVSVGLSRYKSGGEGFENWSWSSNYRMLDDDSKSWLADVNGDGTADLVTQGGAKESAAGWVSVGLSRYKSGGNGFENWSWSSYSRMLDDDSKSWLADVDGDGRADLVTQGGAKESAAGWVSVGLSAYRNGGQGFDNWTWSSNAPRLDNNSTSWLGDVNGDSRADLVTQSYEGMPNINFGFSDGLSFGWWSVSWSW